MDLHYIWVLGNGRLLRCRKGTTWEGGQRETAIAWWPNKIKPKVGLQNCQQQWIYSQLYVVLLDLKSQTLYWMEWPVLFEEKPSKRDDYINIYILSKKSKPKGQYICYQMETHFYQQGSHCQNTHPDIVCYSNYTMHKNDAPMLFNVEQDPSEFYLTFSRNIYRHRLVVQKCNNMYTYVCINMLYF